MRNYNYFITLNDGFNNCEYVDIKNINILNIMNVVIIISALLEK